MNRTLYTLLFHLGLPLVFLRLLWRAWRARPIRRIGERFAFGLPRLRPGGIWVHAVSVGESIAAAPMVRELMARAARSPSPAPRPVPSASRRCSATACSIATCPMTCLDRGAFSDRLQPKLAVVMETELWPNHIHQCARRGIPVALANARLSERSARGYARFARLTAPMLAELSLIAVQTETEAERFRQLGARHECVEVTGSIKFDLTIDPALLARATDLRDQWAAQDRPLWIAASTHAGEDEIVLAAHRRLLERFPQALLLLVPRIRNASSRCMNWRARKALPRCAARRARRLAPARVLVGDTMGELLFLCPGRRGLRRWQPGAQWRTQPAGACGVGQAGAQWPASVQLSRNLRAAARCRRPARSTGCRSAG